MFGKLLKSIRLNLGLGLLLVTPLAITVFIVNFLFTRATNWAGKITGTFGLPPVDRLVWRIFALFVLLVGFYLIGLFTRNVIGRSLYRFGERLITRIPVFSRVYLFVRQVVAAIFRSRETLFKEVVMIEYPRKDAYSIAFVTATLPRDVAERMYGPDFREDAVSLFVPTTPNPTSGVLQFLPRSQVVALRISVLDGMKLVMSGGVFMHSETGNDANQSLVDRIQTWTQPPPAASQEESPADA